MAVTESKSMDIGTPLIPFHLKNYDGRMIHSNSFSKHKLLLIVFTCNHCPYAKASWPVLIDLHKRYAGEGLQIVAINPNNNSKYPEDSFEAMQTYVQEIGIPFPYLFDEDQNLALSYNATCTPDPFLFSHYRGQSLSFTLLYHGRLNDNWQDREKVVENSMELFVLSVLRKGPQPKQIYPSMGCSIKWV